MSTALSITPGEILLEKFLIPMEVSQNKLAKSINVSPSCINSIINGERAITAETALRLSPGLRFNLAAAMLPLI